MTSPLHLGRQVVYCGHLARLCLEERMRQFGVTPVQAYAMRFLARGEEAREITQRDLEHIQLEPGYYLISYKVAAVFRTPNYMQVTPYYNGTSHLETGIYFATSANGSSACGSAYIILRAPSQTTFTLSYNGSANAVDGEINLTILKLRRPL